MVTSISDVTFFDTFEDMMDAESKAGEAADAMVQPWQKECRAGDILVSDPGYGFPVFHEILDIEKIVKDDLWKYGDEYEEEAIYMLDTYNEPHMRNYRFTRSYSVVVPQGEFGDIHLSIATGKVSREYFNELKGRGFVLETEGD
jgi:hypothetical protein